MSDSTSTDASQYPNEYDGGTHHIPRMWKEFEDDGWVPKGVWNDAAMCEDFDLHTVDRQYVHVTNGIPGEDDMIGNHITEVPTIGMCINGTMTKLTWGEALELAQALTAATRVGYYG